MVSIGFIMDLDIGQHEQDNGGDIVSPVSPSLMAVEPMAGASAPDEASLANDGPPPTMATQDDGDGAPHHSKHVYTCTFVC